METYAASVMHTGTDDVINIHGGGAYGNKTEALDRFRRSLDVAEGVQASDRRER